MRLRDFDLNLLTAFDALMQEGNVSRAAERMFITQSAMSHALNRLRDLLDDPILVRTSEGMRATPRAKKMTVDVREVLNEIQQIVGEPESFHPATSKHQFVIEAADYMEYMILPRLMERIYRHAPGIEIQIKKPKSYFPEKDMENGSTDIVVGFDKDLDVPMRMHKEVLFTDQRVCLLRNDHPLVKKKLSQSLYLKLDHIRVSPTGTKTGEIDKVLSVNNQERHIALIVPHFLYLPHLLTTTNLVASPPLRIARQFIQISPLKMLSLPITFPAYQISMVWSPIRDKDPTHVWLREQIYSISKDISLDAQQIER